MPPRGAGCAPILAAGERGSARRNRRERIGVAGQKESGRCRRLPRPTPRDRGGRSLAATAGPGRRRAPPRCEGGEGIVAGGYGHSRLGEWIFGGVTRELLSASPVCCMLSH